MIFRILVSCLVLDVAALLTAEVLHDSYDGEPWFAPYKPVLKKARPVMGVGVIVWIALLIIAVVMTS